MSYQRDYDFAYTQAHNYGGLRDHAQLHNVARAFAALREKDDPAAATFMHFWTLWNEGRVVARNADATDWDVS